jgi:hypothetical protein
VRSQLVPLVGRDAEMGKLALALGAAADGEAGVVALVGEAGVGKSRLVEEGMALARARRLRPAIQDGGRIAVIDVTPPQDQVARRSVSLYAAGLLTRTSDGGVHSEESYRAWLEEAGFHDTRCVEASRTLPRSVMTGSA